MQRLFVAAIVFFVFSGLAYGIELVLFSKFLFLADAAVFGVSVFLAAFGNEE